MVGEIPIFPSYPLAVKHGLLENPSFMYDFPSYKPPFLGNFPLPCLIFGGYITNPINIINHTYCSYVPQLSYRLGPPLC